MDKKYKFIIFDLIGTLADDQSVSHATKMLEGKIGKEMIDLIIDGGRIDTEKTVGDVILRVKNKKAISGEEETLIRKWIEVDSTILFPDALEILKYLKEKGYQIGVISNSPPTTQNQLKGLGIDSFIDFALFSFECCYAKPDPKIFELFLKKAGVPASECVMVGNSVNEDYVGAKAVGIDAILLDRNNVADFEPKIRDLSELKKIF